MLALVASARFTGLPRCWPRRLSRVSATAAELSTNNSPGLRQVEVLAGKDKGKQGTVSQVIEERNWVVVEGLNAHYRMVGQTATFPGTMIASEAPLLVDDQVALLDPADK